MPSTLTPFPGRPRSEYLSPPGAPDVHVIIEAEGLTADQVEAVMRTVLEMICDARGITKPRLTADRTRVALAAALDALEGS